MKNRKWAIVPEGTHWRAALAERRVSWTNRNLDEIHSAIEEDVYMRALNAQKLTHIARLYGVPVADFQKVYGDVWNLGHSELQSIIRDDCLHHGLTSKIPVSKIWMGKALGGLGETPSISAEGEATDDGSVQINVKVIRKEPEAD
jgi:hypothetical protein